MRGTSDTVGKSTASSAYRLATKRESPVARALFQRENILRTCSSVMGSASAVALALRKKRPSSVLEDGATFAEEVTGKATRLTLIGAKALTVVDAAKAAAKKN